MIPLLVEYSEDDPGCMSGVLVPLLLVLSGLYAKRLWRGRHREGRTVTR